MLEIRLLGEQRITVGGERVDVGGSTRTVGLLGHLVVHGGAPQLRQHVAGQFWPDSTDAQARTNLRRELHRLRTLLPDADRCLGVDDTALWWRDDAPCVVDVLAFRRAADEADAAAREDDEAAFVAAAERAVEAYGGDLLPGFYDDWVVAARDQLRRRCVGLLERLASSGEERDELTEAVEHMRRRVELEPFEEPGYRRLMELQARSGDRAAALRTFHRCATVLERELGLEPDEDTTAVYETLVAPRREQVVAVPSLRHTAPLVGRDADFEALRDRWTRVAEGPHMVVVTGEAGVGKTRVVAELAAAVARTGATTAHARCFASRGRLALAPVAEWLRGTDLRPALDRLEPVWRAEVGRLVPELAVDEPGPPASLTDPSQRRRFLEGLARAVLAADPPVLLVLDDLQWCDAETLAWLDLLLHLDRRAPVLVVATARPEDLPDRSELARWQRRLHASGSLEELELAPLSVEETGRLAAALASEPLDAGSRRRLQERTGGLPLLVVESVRGGDEGSSRIDAVLADRLAPLGPAAEELVAVAAVAGRDVSLDLLAAAADLDGEALVAAVDELWQRRLLREHSATSYDLTHDLLRDTAYSRLTPPHRRLLHRRVAAALEQLHAHEPEAVAAQVAEQYERGGQPDRAIPHHVRAAEAATAVFAHDDAVDHYERTLALLADLPASAGRDRQELELLEAMLWSLVALSSYASPRLGQALERIGELAGRLGEAQTAIRSQAALSAFFVVQGRIRDSLRLTDRLAEPASDGRELSGQLALACGWTLTSLGRLGEALDHLTACEDQAAPDEVSPLGFPVQVMARSWRAQTLWLLGRADEAAESAAAAIELADRLDHPFGRAIAQGYAAIVRHLLGDTEGCLALATSVRKLCDRYDFAYYGEWGRMLEGRTLGGDPGEALLREGVDRLERQHAGRARPFWLSLLAEVLADAGRADDAGRVLDDARDWADEHGDLWWSAELWRLEAALHLDTQAAEPLLERGLGVAREQGAIALELRAAIDLAHRHRETGRAEDATDLLAGVLDRAGACNPDDLAAAQALVDDR